MERYFLIGIKGTGMSALAICLKQLGYGVSGSDDKERFFTDEALEQEGIEVFEFNEENITGDAHYIIGAAYDYKHIEVRKVTKQKYPYQYYHDFIENFFKGTKIGISGTHGKTTTTRLVTHFLKDQLTSAVIGDGVGIGVKDYQYFVIESCEYKNHFLKFNYDYLVINNIGFDHPDFFKDIDDVLLSFQKVALKTKYLIVNGDDEYALKVIHERRITFGFGSDCDVRCVVKEVLANGYQVCVLTKTESYNLFLPFLGTHMIYNFLAAFTLYYLITGSGNVQEQLAVYKNPRRRMEEYPYYDNVIIDDYAHHPTEIKACLEAIGLKYPQKKIVVFFQPHTYSRTLALAYEFSTCFEQASEVYLAKTFTSKREKYNSELEKEVSSLFPKAKRFHEGIIKTLDAYQNTVIVFMGAGNIRKHIATILQRNKK